MTKPTSVRQPSSRLARWLWGGLALGVVWVVGAFGDAYVAFALLPPAVGCCAWQFFRGRFGGGKPDRWPALVVGNGLILALLLSLLFLGFETYYRFICDRTDAMGNTLVSGAWTARHFRTNNLGVRDNVDYANGLTPGRRRITFVGDSFTAGYGVKDVDKRFVNLIRLGHPEWEIHAAAKPGLDTSTEVDLMHQLTVSNGYRLDLVVLVYQINDIGEVMPGWKAGYQQMMADGFRKSWLCRHSYVVNLFYHRWQLRRNAYMQKYFDEVQAAYAGPLWEIEKLGLLAFGNLTQLRGGRLLVVTFPYMDTASRFQAVHDQLNHYWRERGIPHLDLLPTFRDLPTAQLVVNAHDGHPNQHAHALAAKAIEEFLKREIARLPPPADP